MPPSPSTGIASSRLDLLLLSSFTAVAAATAAVYFQNRRSTRNSRIGSSEALPASIAASPYAQHARIAIRLALQAGENMRSYCNDKGTAQEANHSDDVGASSIQTKGSPEDFCTQVDIRNEALVMEGLRKVFPKHDIIGEETVGTGTLPVLSKTTPTWIIDPIDGTTNFAAGLPMTCVSIGLCVGGKPMIGIVYAPMTDELYVAVRGYGAFRNGVALMRHEGITEGSTNSSATSFSEGPIKTLRDSVVCFEFGYARNPEAVDAMVGAVSRLLNHGCRTTRSIGSGVLDLCYVAAGRLDVVYAGLAGEGWKPWDYCAGMVIALETGCAMETIPVPEADKGIYEFDIYSDSFICAINKSLLQEMRSVLLDKKMIGS